MTFVYDDGGHAAAGYTGEARDFVTRAIAIATGKAYQEVYDDLNRLVSAECPRQRRALGDGGPVSRFFPFPLLIGNGKRC
jgi:hypothetical protein